MAIHDDLQGILATLNQDELDDLGLVLDVNYLHDLHSLPKLQPLLQNYSIQCIGNGNSKIYQVTKLGSTESCILKLEAWSMPQDIAERFHRNPVLNQAIAPVYSNQDCTVDGAVKRIQIQPYCVGGTIESAGLKPMTDEVRLNNCQNIFQQVAKFYTALESEHILFPDGKSSNFTLNEAGELALTDMKTYVDATPHTLESAPQINAQNYALYIPKPPPRELSKIHSQHLGINLYAYLSGSKFTDLYENPSLHGGEWIPKPIASYDFSKPIFSTEPGKLYKSLIQSMFSTDQTIRPDAIEVQRALDAIHLITQLEASPQHLTFRDFILLDNDAIRYFTDEQQETITSVKALILNLKNTAPPKDVIAFASALMSQDNVKISTQYNLLVQHATQPDVLSVAIQNCDPLWQEKISIANDECQQSIANAQRSFKARFREQQTMLNPAQAKVEKTVNQSNKEQDASSSPIRRV